MFLFCTIFLFLWSTYQHGQGAAAAAESAPRRFAPPEEREVHSPEVFSRAVHQAHLKGILGRGQKCDCC